MDSLNGEMQKWVSSFDETLQVLLITFDENVIFSLVDILDKVPNCSHIALSSTYLDNKRVNKQKDTSPIEVKYPGKIISTIDFGKNPKPCLFFGDFVGTNRLTEVGLDYYSRVDREPKYRKFCRSVMLFRMNAIPPANGFWCTSGPVAKGTPIIKLQLSEWGRMCQNIPAYNTVGSSITNIGNVRISLEWLNALKTHLRYLITEIAGSDRYTEAMLSDSNMEIWVKAFMHKSYNRIYGYESLEYFGDKICSAKFSFYMISKYPRLGPTELSEYHNQYMSLDHQWYLSDDLCLIDFMLLDPDITAKGHNYKKRKTDIFESFVGALFQTAINAVNEQTGSNFTAMAHAEKLTCNLFIMIGEQFPFEKKMIFGKSEHRCTQILQSLGVKFGEDEFQIGLFEENKGTATAKSHYYVKESQKVLAVLNNVKEVTKKDITGIMNVRYSFIPQYVSQATGKLEFWDRIAKVFDDNNFTIRDAKSMKFSFISMLKIVDSELCDRVRAKISMTYPDKDPDELLARIQFDSTTATEEEGTIPYVIMYINTFIEEPNSKMLISFSTYDDLTHKAGDDYMEEDVNTVQITNLACVPIPLEKGNVGAYTLNTFELAQYNCCLKYTTS